MVGAFHDPGGVCSAADGVDGADAVGEAADAEVIPVAGDVVGDAPVEAGVGGAVDAPAGAGGGVDDVVVVGIEDDLGDGAAAEEGGADAGPGLASVGAAHDADAADIEAHVVAGTDDDEVAVCGADSDAADAHERPLVAEGGPVHA